MSLEWSPGKRQERERSRKSTEINNGLKLPKFGKKLSVQIQEAYTSKRDSWSPFTGKLIGANSKHYKANDIHFNETWKIKTKTLNS